MDHSYYHTAAGQNRCMARFMVPGTVQASAQEGAEYVVWQEKEMPGRCVRLQQVAYCVCEEGMALAAGELYRCQAGHVGSKVHQERTLQTRLVACPGVKNRRKMEESVMPVVLTD